VADDSLRHDSEVPHVLSINLGGRCLEKGFV